MAKYAEEVARAVLERLGELAPAWQVLDVEPHNDPMPTPPGMTSARHLRLTLGLSVDDETSVGVYFSLSAPTDQAVVATAEQIQDHAIEATHGAALPPCPGHQHPMSARSVDGVASWTCPLAPEHHVEPILPGHVL